MNSIAAEGLEQLLVAVRRRILALRVAEALRTASWIISALVLSAALVHFFLHSLDARWLLPLAVTPAVIALVSMARRPSRYECADWADRHLEGNSAFATFIEASTVASPPPHSSALARLRSYVDERASYSLSALKTRPRDTAFVRPLAAALVCTVLAAALMQIPGHDSRSTDASRTARAAGERRNTADPANENHQQLGPTAAPLGADREASDSPSQDPQAKADLEALKRPSRSEEATTNAGSQTEPQTVASQASADPGSSREPATGREAGSSRDSSEGLQSSAWEGTLVTKLRSLTRRETSAQQRADPDQAAEYTNGAGMDVSGSDSLLPEPLPAAAPRARDETTLDPAAQAYVRRYFASAGDAP